VTQSSYDRGDPNSLFTWIDQREAAAGALFRDVLADLGLHARPRLGRSAFVRDQFAVKPLVAANTAANLAALNADGKLLADLRQNFHPQSLLEVLIRHAILLECGVAFRGNTPWVERELVNIGSIAAYFPGPATVDELRARPDGAGLRELHDALQVLSTLSREELTRLAGGTLDLASHRLDAWITSMATRRVDELRAHPGRAKGLTLGAYGWVTQLKPNLSAPPVPDELIHAPSLAQATTAAILRAGYQAHRDAGGALAVDLSSARVRRAQWLLDGVRAGQSPGALLGYGFERGLAEREQPGRLLRQFVAPFRKLAPLPASLPLPGAAESLGAHDVADGVALARIWRANRGRTPLPLGATASFEARIFVTAVDPDFDVIAGKQASDADRDWLFGLQGGHLCLGWHTAAGSGLSRSAAPVPLNRWVHVAAVRDHDRVTFYIDRVPEESAARPDAQPFRVGAMPLRLGALAGATRRLKGRLREVRLWNVARSAEEIRRGALGALTIVEAGLAGYWRFDEITGDSALDRSPWGNHGSFQNGQPPWVEVGDDPGWAGGKYALELGSGAFVEVPHQPVLSLGPVPGLPTVAADQALVTAALEQLADDADAVSDLALAESIHQVALGNPSRAAATLEAMANGLVPPPELEVLRTPRGAVAHTQRLMVWLGDGNQAAGWPTDARQARAQAEPLVNEWAARLLGPARRTWYRADFLDAAGAVLSSSEHHLEDLALSPLDFVYLAPDELVARIRLARAAEVGAAAEVRVDFARGASWDADRASVQELTELAAALRRLLGGARAMTGADVTVPRPGEVPADAVDAGELSGRVTRVRQQMTNLRGALGNSATLSETLRGLAHCGVPCMPAPGADLAALAAAAAAEVDRRFTRADGAADDLSRMAELLGGGFRAVGRLAPAPDAQASLSAALSRSDWNAAEIRRQTWRWVSAHARVREAVSRLDDLLLYDTALNRGAAALSVAQLPMVAGEPWVGSARAGDVADGRLSLVVLGAGADRLAGGLLVDEWVDSVPRPSHTTGVAFHCDAPGAAPPHAVLLAVPPDDRPSWSVAGLETVLAETMELFRLRLVGPRDLAAAGHFLPATFLAFNPNNETVSTDLTALPPEGA
jgi:Concanavalin A-like lectin/glucanases superfamily